MAAPTPRIADVVEAVRRVVALQAQSAASPYLALWNRLAGVVGYVAGVWRPVDSGIEATAFHELPDGAWAGLTAEADALVAFLADREPMVYRSGGAEETPRAPVSRVSQKCASPTPEPMFSQPSPPTRPSMGLGAGEL